MRIKPSLFLFGALALLLTAAPLQARHLATLTVSNTTTDTPCEPGPEVREFQATDERVTVFAIFQDLLAGDRVSIIYLQPDGQTYTASNFEGVPNDGNWCFASSVRIAGQNAATLPGLWTVGVTVNGVGTLDGVPLQTTFTIQSNLLTNGSFEQPGNFAAARYVSLGDPFITGWTVTQGEVEYVGGFWKAAQGQYSIDMNGTRAGTIAQTVATTAGRSYTLSFALAGNPSQTGEKRLRVSAAGQVQDFTFFNNAATTATNMGWQVRTWSFTASGSSTTISFQSLSFGDAGPVLDNVILSSSGGGTTPTCNYFVSPQGATIESGGGTGMALVNTTPGCSWTATSNAAWIVIESGGSGTGSGAVGYRVAANTTGAERVGTLTIAGQTHMVTQSGGPACTFTIAPTAATVAATGETRNITVLASAGSCGWTATSNSPWITITSGSSGSGNGAVSYAVAANTAETPRSGTLTVAGQTATVNQAGASPVTGGPMLGGAVNAASGLPQTAPGGGLARGSFFSLYGTGIGPTTWQQATSFPLPRQLGGAEVFVRQGGTQMACVLAFVSNTQINAILPSNAPLGDAEIVVRYQGREATIAARIVQNAFGIFSLQGGRGPGIVQNFVSSTDTPLNSKTLTASPGQAVIIWGTGMGPISAPDDMPPPVGDLPVDVEVQIGGKPARILYKGRAPCCAGVDEIVAELAPDTPQGCNVPLQVRAGEVWSNVVTIAVDPDHNACSEEVDVPFIDMAATGGRTGAVVLARGQVFAEVEGEEEPLNLTVDLGVGIFVEAGSLSGNSLFDMLTAAPPLGTCVSIAQTQDLGGLLGSLDLSNPTGVLGDDLPPLTGLNAGPSLTLRNGAGLTGELATMSEDSVGLYIGLLGGEIPLLGASETPPMLGGGAYSLIGPGGPDVSAFSTDFVLPAPVTWLNRAKVTSLTPGAPTEITWSGGQPNQLVLIVGGAADSATDTLGGFVCAERATVGRFLVPGSATANLPSSGPSASLEGEGGLLGLATMPVEDFPTFMASGLDRGFILNSSVNIRTVSVGGGGTTPTPTLPSIQSISPTSARAGESFTLTVTGANLDSVTAMEINPSAGVTIGAVQRTAALSPSGAEQAVRLTAAVSIAPTASPGVRTITVVSPAGRSNGATFDVLPMASGSGLRISNFVANARVEGFTGLVLGAGFNFEAPLGNIVWTGDKATSAKLEVSLDSTTSTNSCRFVLAGSPLNFPGQTTGTLSVGPVPTFQQDLAVSGSGTASITLIDPLGNRSNTLTAPVGADPLCPAGSPAREFVFP